MAEKGKKSKQRKKLVKKLAKKVIKKAKKEAKKEEKKSNTEVDRSEVKPPSRRCQNAHVVARMPACVRARNH